MKRVVLIVISFLLFIGCANAIEISSVSAVMYNLNDNTII